jgi:hypothetical protein
VVGGRAYGAVCGFGVSFVKRDGGDDGLICDRTVTGAWWAGEGVAKRIVRAYGLGGEGQEDGDGHELVSKGA